MLLHKLAIFSGFTLGRSHDCSGESKVTLGPTYNKAQLSANHMHYSGSAHYSDIIMSAIVSQITGVSIVYSAVCSGEDQRKHQSSASLGRIHVPTARWPVNSLHKGPVTRKMPPFHDVIMNVQALVNISDYIVSELQKWGCFIEASSCRIIAYRSRYLLYKYRT